MPEILLVRLSVTLPLLIAVLAGNVACASEEARCTVSLVLIRFQLASTERTVTLKEVPAVWAVGLPVLPDELPGAAVSPGINTCSLAKAPRLTVMLGLV